MRAMSAVTDILRGVSKISRVPVKAAQSEERGPLLQVAFSMSTASQSSLSGVDNASSKSQMV